jgi:hypothetical protein
LIYVFLEGETLFEVLFKILFGLGLYTPPKTAAILLDALLILSKVSASK